MKNTLPKIAVACTLVTMLGFQSCDKIKDAVKIPDITFTGANTDVIIPATQDTLTQSSLATAAISYNIDSMIKAETGGVVTYSSIKSVKITAITLSLSDADATNSFGNFKTAAATFNTNANGGALQPYTIANIENNPDAYSFTLPLTLIDKDTDLKQYFGSGNVAFTYAVIGQLRHATTKPLTCHVAVSYSIGF